MDTNSAYVTTENKAELLIKQDGKTLYAIAYLSKTLATRVRHILAVDYGDAMRQVYRSRRDLGTVLSVGPAIGAFGKHEERKRIYCYG